MGDVKDQIAEATIATSPKKNTTPTTFQSISGFALPSIRASQQSTSPIGFLFWNFRHRLVRYYWYHTLQMYLDFIRFMVSNCSKMYQNKKIIFHSSNLHKLCTMFFRNDSCSSLPQPGDRLARARRARRAWRARGAWPALLDSATRRQGGKGQRWGCGE